MGLPQVSVEVGRVRAAAGLKGGKGRGGRS